MSSAAAGGTPIMTATSSLLCSLHPFSFPLSGHILCHTSGCRVSSAHLLDLTRFLSRNSRWHVEAAKELTDSESTSETEEVGLSVDKGSRSTAARKGFGQVASSSGPKPASAKGSKGKKVAAVPKSVKEGKRSTIVRRVPSVKPVATSEIDPRNQRIETAFILSLAFLGAIILVEGLLLAATGLLPEEWDVFFVTYLYPSFTPTVGVFLISAVGYGLYKALGVESKRD